MALLSSLGLALAVLGLRLIIQSLVLSTKDPAKKTRLSKKINTVTIFLIAPMGLIMAIVGVIWNSLENSFLPVGITLIATSITMLIQSESLDATDEKET